MTTVAIARAPQSPPTAPTNREHGRLKIVLFPLRLFLALGWLRAGAAKVIDGEWWSGEYLAQFLDDHAESMLPFLTGTTATLESPLGALVALGVLIAEFVIAGCMVTGRRLRPALWLACALNVSFVVYGAVNPSAFYLVLQMTLLLALTTARPAPLRRSAITEIALWGALGMLMLPFVTTMHPAAVIEDPAIMLATLAVLRAGTLTVLAVERRDEYGS